MTITGLYTQNLTLSFNSSSSSSSLLTPAVANVTASPDRGTAPAATASPATDTVSISAEAIRKQTMVVTMTLAPAPTEAKEPARGDALFEALDADGDGAVTKDEFVDGARELLQSSERHGRSHGRHRGDRFDGSGRDDRDSSRLTRRLERLFERVDANGDGAVAKTELAGALQGTKPSQKIAPATTVPERSEPITPATAEPRTKARSSHSDPTPGPALIPVPDPASEAAPPTTTNEQPQPPVGDAPTPGTFMTITQITITIAIQQYTTVSAGSTAPANTLNQAA